MNIIIYDHFFISFASTQEFGKDKVLYVSLNQKLYLINR